VVAFGNMEKEYGYVHDINIKIYHFQVEGIDTGVNMIKEDIHLTEAEIEFIKRKRKEEADYNKMISEKPTVYTGKRKGKIRLNIPKCSYDTNVFNLLYPKYVDERIRLSYKNI